MTQVRVSFQDYLKMVELARRANPYWRLGQTYFNVLHFSLGHPMADHIRGTDMDPFYEDEDVPEFLEYAEREWDRF